MHYIEHKQVKILPLRASLMRPLPASQGARGKTLQLRPPILGNEPIRLVQYAG